MQKIHDLFEDDKSARCEVFIVSLRLVSCRLSFILEIFISCKEILCVRSTSSSDMNNKVRMFYSRFFIENKWREKKIHETLFILDQAETLFAPDSKFFPDIRKLIKNRSSWRNVMLQHLNSFSGRNSCGWNMKASCRMWKQWKMIFMKREKMSRDKKFPRASFMSFLASHASFM